MWQRLRKLGREHPQRAVPVCRADGRLGALACRGVGWSQPELCCPLSCAEQQDGHGGCDGPAGGHARHTGLCGQPVREPVCAAASHGVCASGECCHPSWASLPPSPLLLCRLEGGTRVAVWEVSELQKAWRSWSEGSLEMGTCTQGAGRARPQLLGGSGIG